MTTEMRLSHLERILQRVDAFDRDLTGRRAKQRRQHLQRGRLAGAVRSEQAENRSASHRKRQAIDRANVGLAAALEDLYEVANDDGGIASIGISPTRSAYRRWRRNRRIPSIIGRPVKRRRRCDRRRESRAATWVRWPPRRRAGSVRSVRCRSAPASDHEEWCANAGNAFAAFRTDREATSRPAATGNDAGRRRSPT